MLTALRESRLRIGWLLIAGLFAACSKDEAPPPPNVIPLAPRASDLVLSPDALSRGARLFQEHCAQCHGPEAQGHPDWQTPGVVAAPPLDGSGNEWKRSKLDLIAIVKNGAKRNGEPVMPGWKGRLSDQEIEEIILWFQTLWPVGVYEQWRGQQAGALKTRR